MLLSSGGVYRSLHIESKIRGILLEGGRRPELIVIQKCEIEKVIEKGSMDEWLEHLKSQIETVGLSCKVVVLPDNGVAVPIDDWLRMIGVKK